MDIKTASRKRIHLRIRKKIQGNSERPRLHVFRSNKAIYAQVIDDLNGVTLASASSKDVSNSGNKSSIAAEVGKLVASKAKNVGIDKVVFDRGGYLFHGRVKSLAEGAREGGLIF